MAADTRWPHTPQQDVYAYALTVPADLDAEEREELESLLARPPERPAVWERRLL